VEFSGFQVSLLMTIATYTMPRSFNGMVIPISVQSCYIRDYCLRNLLQFSLPITEMCKPLSFVALHQIIQETSASFDELIIIVCSLFVFEEILEIPSFPRELLGNICIHSVLENSILDFGEVLSYIEEAKDIQSLENSLFDLSDLY